jgi:MtN3 and saliva related transmembrane protein
VTTSDILAVAATCAGTIMAIGPILQIRRMRRTRSSNDVSLLWLAMLDVGFVVFVSYGWSISNGVLIVTNSASLLVMTITILTALAFRRGGARRAAASLAAENEARADPEPDAATG